MHLVGGHDYYDHAVPYDTDKTRTFVRNVEATNEAIVLDIPGTWRTLKIAFDTSEFKGERPRRTYSYEYQTYILGGVEYSFQPQYVVFCGKLYHGVRVHEYDSDIRRATYERRDRYYWNVEKFNHYIEQLGLKVRSRRRTDDDKWTRKWRPETGLIYLENYEDAFKVETLPETKIRELVKLGIVTAVSFLQDYKLLWSFNRDNLQTVNFHVAVNHFDAYQEIDMFLGTILVNDQDNMVKLSDQSLAAKHGFDKWSFKNPVHAGKPRGNK